jgi:hypothetical protein
MNILNYSAYLSLEFINLFMRKLYCYYEIDLENGNKMYGWYDHIQYEPSFNNRCVNCGFEKSKHGTRLEINHIL